MGLSIQRRRGTTTQHSTFTGKIGEITIDTTKSVVVVHDGTTSGGWPMSRFDHTHPNATDSVPGFLSASDKTKLDTIAGGSIYYQTVQVNGTSQPQENNLNVTTNFTSTDDSGGHRTTIDLSNTGVISGTYTKFTVDIYGRITAGNNLLVTDIPTLTSAKISDFAATAQSYALNLFTAPSTNLSLNGYKIINLADPVSSSDAATKNYVDNIAVGLSFKASCVAASTANVNIAAPGTTLDTVSLSVGNRVLLKNQSSASENGFYVFNGASTPLTRSLDASSGSQLESGTFVFIDVGGSVNGGTAWVLSTSGTITIGTTPLTFVQFSAGNFMAGNGIEIIANAIEVETANSSHITVGVSGVDLATTSVTPGTYDTVTVDAYGRVTSASLINYQALDVNLTGLSSGSLTTTGLVTNLGSGSFTTRSVQPGTGILITNGSGVAGNIGIALATSGAGAAVQGNSNLSTPGYMPYVSSAGTLNIDTSGIFWNNTSHKVTSYGGIATYGNGLIINATTFNVLGQSATTSTNDLLVIPVAGMYVIRVSIAITTPASGGSPSSTLPSVSIVYNQQESNTVITVQATSTNSTNTTSNVQTGTVIASCYAGSNLYLNTAGYVSVGSTSMLYSIHANVEFLG